MKTFKQYLNESHMMGKTVIVAGKQGKVTKFIGSEHGTEKYKVKLEDGSVITASSIEMEMASESYEMNEAKTGDLEFTYPNAGQAKAFSNSLVVGGVVGVVVKRGKTVIFNLSDLNKADKMGKKTLADLVQTARSNNAKIKSHGFSIDYIKEKVC